MSAPAYDRIGIGYIDVRRADPRFEAAIWEALGDAHCCCRPSSGQGLDRLRQDLERGEWGCRYGAATARHARNGLATRKGGVRSKARNGLTLQINIHVGGLRCTFEL